MSIRLLSDLHLEFGSKFPKFTKKAEIAILAGDIGSPYEDHYQEFIKYVSREHDKVLVITGNHEYYGELSIEDTENKIKSIVGQYENVYFLQKECHVHNNIKFIGCTLWSKIYNPRWCKYMNDFNKIPKMTFDKYKELHEDHSLWLHNQLLTNDNVDDNVDDNMDDNVDNKYKKYVITHHLPSHKLIDKKYSQEYRTNCFFATDIDMTNSDMWFYGHTHTANNIIINNTLCCCNPGGYPFECETGFDPDFIVE